MTRRPRVFLGHAISALATLPMIYELLLNRDSGDTQAHRSYGLSLHRHTRRHCGGSGRTIDGWSSEVGAALNRFNRLNPGGGSRGKRFAAGF